MRIALAMLAVAALTWLLVGARDDILLERGLRETALKGVAGNIARAERDFKQSRLLNPDSQPVLRRAVLDNFTGRHREAIALLQSVVRAEPQNSSAWSALFVIANGQDDAIAEQSAAAIRRLDPLVGRKG